MLKAAQGTYPPFETKKRASRDALDTFWAPKSLFYVDLKIRHNVTHTHYYYIKTCTPLSYRRKRFNLDAFPFSANFTPNGGIMSTIELHLVHFSIPGKPQQRGSKRMVRAGNGRTVALDMNTKSKDWMHLAALIAAETVGPRGLLRGPIELTAHFFFARPMSHFGSGRNAGTLKASAPTRHAQSPDLAKLLRSLEDALSGVVWLDDRLVCRYGEGTGRYWADLDDGARTEVWIRALGRQEGP